MKTVAIGAISAILAGAASAQLDKLGALGDSLSDEYAEESYSYAKNWLEQLRQYRGVDVGPTAAEAGQAGGTWGEPRRTKFRHDWARSGATSSTLLSQGQHTGCAGQAGLGVTHAVIAIGANDFSPAGSAYFNIYFGLWSQSQITAYVNQRIANVQTAVDTVRGAGIGVVLGTFVDYGVAPVTWQQAIYSDASRRQRVTDVISRVNDGILAMARARRIPVVDLFAMGFAIYGPHTAHRHYLTLGGRDIDLWSSDTTGNTNPLAGQVHDGVHPHTTLQGIFANVIAGALRLGYGDGPDPFTEAEILAHAGLAYGGAETLAAQIGDWREYVINFACLADFNEDGFVTGDDIDEFIGAFLAGDVSADYTGDGFVTGDDFDGFVAGFESGC